MTRIEDIAAINEVRESGLAKPLPSKPRIAVGMGTCGSGNGAEAVYQAFASATDERGLDVQLAPVGCCAMCSEEPLVNLWMPGRPLLILHRVQPNHVRAVLNAVGNGAPPPGEIVLSRVEEWDHITGHVNYGVGYPEIPCWHEVPFSTGQVKIVLRNRGLINPDDIEEYVAIGGYQALYKVLIDENPGRVIEQIKTAKLRGRGGAGFLTGNKWEYLRAATGSEKYLICNADEGDPGAYMNRNEIESDPHALLEDMLIGGYVTGATRGIIYVRAEYPLAVLRLERAIEQAREYGVLGENVLGRGLDFQIQLVEGAGAFVCGQETALIESLEGHSGRPRPRPPFPAQRGRWAKPTNINNVETWYNVAPIVSKGPIWFTGTGSAKSAGTKVFSLVGKLKSTGLVELPLGTRLSRFIYDIGGGGVNGREIKAVHTGGPSGGRIPVEMFDTPVDYESLAQLGSIMGSGGMVVMDEDNCMVDVARYFIEFTHSESCGKCIPCRVGLDQALRMLDGFTKGTATHADLQALDEVSRMVRGTSLCGLGQSGPNPVLTTLRHFRHEFEDHIEAKRCRAGVCEDLNARLDPAAREKIRSGLPAARHIVQRTLRLWKGAVDRFTDEVESFANFPTLYGGLVAPDGSLRLYDGGLRFVGPDGAIVADQVRPEDYASYIGEATLADSYMKAPYYKPLGYPAGICRVGPLARLNVAERCGAPEADRELIEYRQRLGRTVQSGFHYHYARLIGATYALERMQRLLEDPAILSSKVRARAGVNCPEGVGIIEAPRGILIHHYKVDDNGAMLWANLIVATGHNNLAIGKGVEQAAQRFIDGHRIQEGALNRVSAVVRAYDPCPSCSTHALDTVPLVLRLLGPDGTLLDELATGDPAVA